MFEGVSQSNPALMDENCFHYQLSSLPQLQLFGELPVGCSVDPINYIGNEHATATSRPIKRVREPEPIPRQQKIHFSLNNNFCPYETGHTGTILKQNVVSTGLRLTYEEDERKSSVTSANEHIKAVLPATFSLSNSVKIEIDRQKEEFDLYIRIQEQNITKGARELTQRHTTSLLKALEKGVGRKLNEKEIEIENMNRKNKELGEKIKQAAMEAQSWQHRAKYNESVVNVLKSNLQQVMAQGALQGREGYGDSEVDDAASNTNHPVPTTQLNCKSCKGKQVSVLVLPCRHLCLCKDCEGFVNICPVCQAVRTASVQVYMS